MMCLTCIENPQESRLDVGDAQVIVTGCAAHLYLMAEVYATGRRIQRAISGFPKDPVHRCGRCGHDSASPWDAIFGYCPGCQAYTG